MIYISFFLFILIDLLLIWMALNLRRSKTFDQHPIIRRLLYKTGLVFAHAWLVCYGFLFVFAPPVSLHQFTSTAIGFALLFWGMVTGGGFLMIFLALIIVKAEKRQFQILVAWAILFASALLFAQQGFQWSRGMLVAKYFGDSYGPASIRILHRQTDPKLVLNFSDELVIPGIEKPSPGGAPINQKLKRCEVYLSREHRMGMIISIYQDHESKQSTLRLDYYQNGYRDPIILKTTEVQLSPTELASIKQSKEMDLMPALKQITKPGPQLQQLTTRLPEEDIIREAFPFIYRKLPLE